MLSCEFCKISKNTFLTKNLWATATKKNDPELLRLVLSDFAELQALKAKYHRNSYNLHVNPSQLVLSRELF